MTQRELGQQPPLFVMRTGLPYSSPYGFFDDLADRLDAHLIVPDDIRVKFVEDHDVPEGQERSLPVREMTRIIAEEQVAHGLNAGINVVYEGLLNQLESRDRLRQVARDCGALTLLIATRADFAYIKTNIEQRGRGEVGEDGPKEDGWVDRKLFTLHSFKRNIEWPSDGEACLSLRCSSDRSKDDLLDIFIRHIDRLYAAQRQNI